MTFLASLWAKIQVPFLIAIAIGGAAMMALRQARKDGVNQVLVEQKEKRDALEQHYKEIDSRPSDHGSAVDRMRQRAAKRDR